MVDQALILAGGLGTRLRDVVKDVPKPMAEVGGKPFLTYVFRYLYQQGIKRCVLAVGHRKEAILSYWGKNYEGLELTYSEEHSPLGTGGAVWNALHLMDERFLLMNGDTLFLVNIKDMEDIFDEKNADIVLALKHIKRPERYGVVKIDEKGRVNKFEEKGKNNDDGLINGGLYLVRAEWLRNMYVIPKVPFSWEKEVLETNVSICRMYGFVAEGYFIDMGIPEDYLRARDELPILYRF